MSDGCKRILIPFTGCKKRKAWNKAREKYMLINRRQNLAETDKQQLPEGCTKIDPPILLQRAN